MRRPPVCRRADRIAVERRAGRVAPRRDGSRAIISCSRRADRCQSLPSARAQGAACADAEPQHGGDPRISDGHRQPAQCRRAGSQLYPIELRLNLAESIARPVTTQPRSSKSPKPKPGQSTPYRSAARAEFLRVRASIRLGATIWRCAERPDRSHEVGPANTSITLQYANLLWHMKRTSESHRLYARYSAAIPRIVMHWRRWLHREGRKRQPAAERYFNQLARITRTTTWPILRWRSLHVHMQFDRANASYEQAFKRAPQNATWLPMRPTSPFSRTHSARLRLG